MNKKTILSSNFPEFLRKWKRYHNKFKKVNSWYITSDYCLENKEKPNDVMTFTIFPLGNPYIIKEEIKRYLPKDIKDFKNISEDAIKYIKESPYFFSLAVIIKDKNNIFNLESNKLLLDRIIENMSNWPDNKKNEFIHKIKNFKEYLNRKTVDLKTLSEINVTVHIMSAILEFLLIKANAKKIIWISDRDKITSFRDGVIHKFIRLGYSNLVHKRVNDNEVYGFLTNEEYDKDVFDELIRIPDYISGAIASMDFSDSYKVAEKHYNLFDKGIVDNEKIYIMQIEHNQNSDTLSELQFSRI